jgi:hypothetical protein
LETKLLKKLKKFLMKINNAYNFSYPQAGFWWLVERKLVILKAAYRGQFIGKNPACV